MILQNQNFVHDLNHHELKLVEERKVACYFFSLDMLERKKTPKFTLSLGLLLSLPNNLSFFQWYL